MKATKPPTQMRQIQILLKNRRWTIARLRDFINEVKEEEEKGESSKGKAGSRSAV